MKGKKHRERWRQIFETLSSATRREILAALLENPPDAAVELPEAANSPEYRRDREQLVLDLKHCHLPKLEEHGLVEWRTEPFCVERGPRFDDAACVIEAIRSYERMPEHLVEGCYYLEQDEVMS